MAEGQLPIGCALRSPIRSPIKAETLPPLAEWHDDMHAICRVITNTRNDQQTSMDTKDKTNIMLASITFRCFFENFEGDDQKKTFFCTFPIKAPPDWEYEDIIFDYARLENKYGSRDFLYKTLFYICDQSRRRKSGHWNPFERKMEDPETGNDARDKYYRHSEKLLVAYLMTEEGTKDLAQKVINEIGKNYSENYTLKVRIDCIGIHLHSAWTPCGSCELVLLALANSEAKDIDANGVKFGFLSNLRRAFDDCKNVEFIVYVQEFGTRFPIFITCTSNDRDSDHSDYKYKFEENDCFPPLDLEKAAQQRDTIFISLLKDKSCTDFSSIFSLFISGDPRNKADLVKIIRDIKNKKI